MQKYEHAFGKNDIRGIYTQDITEELFYNIGLNYPLWLSSYNNKTISAQKISVCMDARTHSLSLKSALIKGLEDAGVTYIEDYGIAPTPIGYYSEFAHNLDGAMIITASHNPKEYNGLKMTYNKTSLNEPQIKEIKDLVFKNWKQMPEHFEQNDYKIDIIPEYINEMVSKFQNVGTGIKIVVDSANGTGGVVGPELYRKLGCEVIELYSVPDGNFPNHHPNPSLLSTLKDISSKIIEEQADFGIAFDGDSDRIGVIDSLGRPLTGDKLLLVYALDIIRAGNKGERVVSEVKCSQVLFDSINAAGGVAIMSKTGHGYIKSKMKETGAILGGEMSGHTFFKDRYYGFDDAVYAGCRMIEIVSKHKRVNPQFKIDSLLKPFDSVVTSDEVRFPCPNELKKSVLESLKSKVNSEPNMFGTPIKEIVTLDGMRIIFDGGFALIRQSNTEPVFTLRFEAKTKENCENYKKTMISYLESELAPV